MGGVIVATIVFIADLYFLIKRDMWGVHREFRVIVCVIQHFLCNLSMIISLLQSFVCIRVNITYMQKSTLDDGLDAWIQQHSYEYLRWTSLLIFLFSFQWLGSIRRYNYSKNISPGWRYINYSQLNFSCSLNCSCSIVLYIFIVIV